jgi:hypothetical protein
LELNVVSRPNLVGKVPVALPNYSLAENFLNSEFVYTGPFSFSGFYFPNTEAAFKYYNGTILEEEYEKKLMVKTFITSKCRRFIVVEVDFSNNIFQQQDY